MSDDQNNQNAMHDLRQPIRPEASFAPSPGSVSPVPTPDKHPQQDYDDEWSGEEDDCCHYCGGDGCVMGDELDDPMWYDADKVYRCPCCNGSGNGKDCTFW